MRSEDFLELIQALLKFPAVACAKSRLLTLLVFAKSTIATTPAAGRLATVAFYL